MKSCINHMQHNIKIRWIDQVITKGWNLLHPNILWKTPKRWGEPFLNKPYLIPFRKKVTTVENEVVLDLYAYTKHKTALIYFSNSVVRRARTAPSKKRRHNKIKQFSDCSVCCCDCFSSYKYRHLLSHTFIDSLVLYYTIYQEVEVSTIHHAAPLINYLPSILVV